MNKRNVKNINNLHQNILFIILITIIIIKIPNKLFISTTKKTSNSIYGLVENPKNNVHYQYTPKEQWQNKENFGVSDEIIGVHSIKINDIVTINKLTDNQNITSLSELENQLGISILKDKNFDYKYINVINTSKDENNYHRFIEEPAEITINLSNYHDFKCDDFIYYINKENPKEETKNHNKCLNDTKASASKKRLNLSIIFKTQFSTQKQQDNFILYLADFPNQETKIYESKILNTKIYISRWNKYIFAYDGIVYIFDNKNNDYTKDEMLSKIENMTKNHDYNNT